MNFAVFPLPCGKAKTQANYITYGIVELLLFSFYITDVPELPSNFGQPESWNIHSNFSTLITVILVYDPSPTANHFSSFLEMKIQAFIVQQLLTGKKRVKLLHGAVQPFRRTLTVWREGQRTV